MLRLSDPPPPQALDLVRANLLHHDDLPFSAQQVSAAQPQPIYSSTIENLMAGQLLAGAVLSAWQYVLIAGDAVQGVAEVALLATGDAPSLAFDVLYPAGYAEAINKAIAHAEKLSGDYALRMLRIPNLSLLAVWLHAATAGDLLLPVGGGPRGLMGHPVFTEAALTAALEPLAQKRGPQPG